jgi:hypothetical protein
VGSRAIATGSGVPMPLPLRPSFFCRSRRAIQDSVASPSLKFPATGVGSSREPPGGSGPDPEDEQAVPAVRGSGVGSAQARPLRIIPERGQVAEDFREAARAERGDVFQEDTVDCTKVLPSGALTCFNGRLHDRLIFDRGIASMGAVGEFARGWRP